MNTTIMPPECFEHIIHCIQPKDFTRAGIKEAARDVLSFSLADKKVHCLSRKRMEQLKTIFLLVNKYQKDQDFYERACKEGFVYNGDQKEPMDPQKPPLLYDALLSGASFARGSMEAYTDEVESDIKRIVKLIPQSIHYNLGTLRCRDKVTPLHVACVNRAIPLHIIELLFQNGADPKATALLNNVIITVLDDLVKNVEPERYGKLKELFTKYGYCN